MFINELLQEFVLVSFPFMIVSQPVQCDTFKVCCLTEPCLVVDLRRQERRHNVEFFRFSQTVRYDLTLSIEFHTHIISDVIF